MSKTFTAVALAATTALTLTAGATTAHAATKPAPKTYQNCGELNRVYPHGVGLKTGRDKVRGSTRPVRTFVVDARTYGLNRGRLDRDHDGIACER